MPECVLPMIRRLVTSLLLVAWLTAVHGANSVAPQTLVYIGTYTGAKSKGIYLSRLDSATGALSVPELVVETANPTFLAVHPNRRFLYAVNEMANPSSQSSPTVTAFGIENATGKLTMLNEQSTGGDGPCHIVMEPSGKNVLVANYGGGSLAVLPINADGRLGARTAFIQHHSSDLNPHRRTIAHAHGITLDSANHFIFCADLGLDQLFSYQFDSAHGALTPNVPPLVSLPLGSGPRHFVFHPAGQYGYVINELASTVTAFTYDSKRGSLEELQSISTVPEDFHGKTYAAEIAIHPNGQFLYASNRGHDSIAVFTIDNQTGKLTLIEHQSAQGKRPRNFGIDSTGKFLLVANQDSDNIVVFQIDSKTGRLQSTGNDVAVNSPVCVIFVPPPLP